MLARHFRRRLHHGQCVFGKICGQRLDQGASLWIWHGGESFKRYREPQIPLSDHVLSLIFCLVLPRLLSFSGLRLSRRCIATRHSTRITHRNQCHGIFEHQASRRFQAFTMIVSTTLNHVWSAISSNASAQWSPRQMEYATALLLRSNISILSLRKLLNFQQKSRQQQLSPHLWYRCLYSSAL